MIPQSLHEPCTSLTLFTDFESKLKAMGFDLHSTADLGKVASVDLTPYKEKEKAERARQEASKAQAVSVTGIFHTWDVHSNRTDLFMIDI
jgi:hypothetical protein